ncbi:MAG TPA: glycosyltransferase [Candidatus Saccharimonadia bacterium]|nr:glycosyltransferase [Candidatus Saccharimonadia bacterium]
MKPEISVIIVVKNDPGVAKTLALLSEQVTKRSYETIVVDASLPETLSTIRGQFPKVHWEQFDQKGKRFTIGEQRNRGMELARGGAILFIDANCEPVPGWIEAIAQAMDDGEDVVTGPCDTSNDGNMVHYIQDHAERTYVRECTTINVGFKREVFKRVGMFDTKLDYGEDVDYFWRVTDAGFKICFDPSARISHDYGDANEQMVRAYRYGKSRAAIHRKHWRTRWKQLLQKEPHVWIYPLFILTLPLALLWPYYLLVLLIPIVKNRSISLVAHHLIYGWGVIMGAITPLGNH